MTDEKNTGPVSIELTEAEKAKLEADARKEIEEELRLKARKEYKEHAKSILKKKSLFSVGKNDAGEDVEELRIDLPSFSPTLRINGSVYYHGGKYKFGQKTAAMVKEMMHRVWLHDAEVKGLNMNEFYGRQTRNRILRGQ